MSPNPTKNDEIERIKREINLLALAEQSGIKLRKIGADSLDVYA